MYERNTRFFFFWYSPLKKRQNYEFRKTLSWYFQFSSRWQTAFVKPRRSAYRLFVLSTTFHGRKDLKVHQTKQTKSYVYRCPWRVSNWGASSTQKTGTRHSTTTAGSMAFGCRTFLPQNEQHNRHSTPCPCDGSQPRTFKAMSENHKDVEDIIGRQHDQHF